MSRPIIEIQVNGYKFKDENILKTALMHSSYCNEHGLPYSSNNQRLEFLGDALLDAVIGEELYRRLPESEEGTLSKMRSMIVCEQSLEKISSTIGIGEKLFLGKGEEMSGVRKTSSVLADAMEAVIGAVYLDGGWEEAKQFVLFNFKQAIDDLLEGHSDPLDHKSELQEILQSKGINDFRYEIVHEEGPDHKKRFFIDFICQGKTLGHGSGRNKKEAEQNAAHEALEVMRRL